MTAATPGRDRLTPGIPYIVTRGSGARTARGFFCLEKERKSSGSVRIWLY